ncbi:MAG: prepilin-type N-terminal cleavage/methylation domain-containing protein [Deltaproteobacteria bacterium]|nr:prepilin-type N-terminal cleavage/methylation domain-containing protein [Deltaproteobacteria bacterium]
MRSYQRFKKKYLAKKNSNRGFTLIEVLFAVAVLAFGLLAVSSLQGSAARGNLMAFNRTEAVTRAQTHMEELLALTYNVLNAGVTPQVIEGNYTIDRVVANGPSDTLQITVTVTYQEKKFQAWPVVLICIKPNV